jgi:hypothetical protein
MLPLRWALLAFGLLRSAQSLALGGLTVHGAGTGQVTSFEYGFHCEDVPFEANIAYLPEDQGIAAFTWWGLPPGCAESGGGVAIGVLNYDLSTRPPVFFQAACSGNEAAGLSCGFLFIGPYHGPGSKVALLKISDQETFRGEFLAV